MIPPVDVHIPSPEPANMLPGILSGKRGSTDVVGLRILDAEAMDCLGGPNVITLVLNSREGCTQR